MERPALTARQREVLDLVLRDHTNAEIAERLGISIQGVKWHVTELLDRYEVTNRSDLIAAVEAGRRPRARLSRLAAGLAGLLSKKVLATGIAVVAVGGIAGGALLLAGMEDDTHAPPAVAAPLVTPAPGSVALPSAAPAAKQSPLEAYARALAVAQEKIDLYVTAGKIGAPLSAAGMPLVEARWLPQTMRYDASNGDNYWIPEGGKPADAWQFRWREENVAQGTNGSLPPPVTLDVEVIVYDDPPAQSTPDYRILLEGSDGSAGGQSSFHSKSHDATSAEHLDPSGPDIHLAWLNNAPDGTELRAYPTRSGNWLFRRVPDESGGSFPMNVSNLGPQPVLAWWGFSRIGQVPHMFVNVFTTSAVTQVAIETPAGRVDIYDTVPYPPEISSALRLAYLETPFISGPIDVVALDANGQELGRVQGQQPDVGIAPTWP
jgi:DNA-binding CsgD family transcriptional regulator